MISVTWHHLVLQSLVAFDQLAQGALVTTDEQKMLYLVTSYHHLVL